MRIIFWSKESSLSVVTLAVKALRKGLSVAYPTETSYGLGVDAANTRAVKQLFAIKGRSFAKPVHVVVAGSDMASRYVRWSASAKRLAGAFWPGPITIVAKARTAGGLKPMPETLNLLTAGTGELGVRMPSCVVPLALVFALGRPVTATSVNVSGGGDCYCAADVVAQFRGRKLKPDILIDAGSLPKQKPSTVVRLGHGMPTVLREGPVSRQQVLRVLV